MPDYSILPISLFAPISFINNKRMSRVMVRAYFSNIQQYLDKFADASQYINCIELFNFSHSCHPWKSEINDPTDLFCGPHKTRINIFVNSHLGGPHIKWILKMLKEDVVYACAHVRALDTFLAEVLFGYNPETDEWVYIEKESDAFKGIVRDLLVLQALK